MSGTGPFGGADDEKTGEITVYCEAPAHAPAIWEQTYERRGNGPWIPDPFEHVGEQVRTPRRGGGMDYIDSANRVVKVWDSGRGIGDHPGVERMLNEIERARAAAGISGDADAPLELGRRYQLRCPMCGDAVRRAEPKLRTQLNHLWQQGIYRISLNGLRTLDRLL